MPIIFTESLDDITPDQLSGFFVDWPDPPSPKTHLHFLQNSGFVILAIDDETGQVIGFINAISDGVLSAYIPLLEVLPRYQKRGIGRELVSRMLEKLNGLYMVDLVCDDNLVTFYEKFGMTPMRAMARRRYDSQSGLKVEL